MLTKILAGIKVYADQNIGTYKGICRPKYWHLQSYIPTKILALKKVYAGQNIGTYKGTVYADQNIGTYNFIKVYADQNIGTYKGICRPKYWLL
jgi:hypothetical protein